MSIAQTITKATENNYRFIARYGGEEFVLVLPETNIQEALIVAESIQKAIADLAIPHMASHVSDRITVSLGIASLIPSTENNLDDLINQADQALYLAKTQGRDRRSCSAIIFE